MIVRRPSTPRRLHRPSIYARSARQESAAAITCGALQEGHGRNSKRRGSRIDVVSATQVMSGSAPSLRSWRRSVSGKLQLGVQFWEL